MLNEQAIVGDKVKVSKSEFYFIDNSPVLEGTVVEIDIVGKLKVVYDFVETEDNLFSNEGTFDWYEQSKVIDIERTFKIVNIDENPEHSTRKIKTFVYMIRILPLISDTEEGYKYRRLFNPTRKELFIYLGTPEEQEICNNPEQDKKVWLSLFRKHHVTLDDIKYEAYIEINSHLQDKIS